MVSEEVLSEGLRDEVKNEQHAHDNVKRRAVQVHEDEAPPNVIEFIGRNPRTLGLIAANSVITVCPWLLTGPILSLLGFGPGGVIGGSIAAWIQSITHPIVRGGIFATLRSAAMGGFGTAIVNGLTSAAGVVGAVIASSFGFFGGR
ncbi:MAG: hypothetical protein M1820_008968 [Bogoriella megaspora]|nr:MAG: hypothetical protein M1820_008968 [Bogoriella megaspora]